MLRSKQIVYMHLEYRELVCPIVLTYAAALMEGKLLGQISPSSGLVYVPPRSYDPVACEWLGDDHLVELKDRGVVTNFTIVTPVQYYGQEKTEPFAKASIMRLGGGTEQIQRNVIGERVLALPGEPRPDKTLPFKDIPKNG